MFAHWQAAVLRASESVCVCVGVCVDANQCFCLTGESEIFLLCVNIHTHCMLTHAHGAIMLIWSRMWSHAHADMEF